MIFSQWQLSSLLFGQRQLEKVLAHPNQNEVVAHYIETDTAKKISAVEIVQPWRQVHDFMLLILSLETARMLEINAPVLRHRGRSSARVQTLDPRRLLARHL